MIEIEYSGETLETYPARIADVYGIKVVEETDKFYLTIGAEGVKSIELSIPHSSSGCENADGSLFKKGERIWLENLDGYSVCVD